MFNLRYIKENPNAMVVTFQIDRDLLGKFSKVVIPRGGKLEQYSPLAQSIFPKSGSFVRVDLAAREGKTYLTISRKFIEWSPEDIGKTEAYLNDFFEGSQPAIYIEAIAQNVAVQAPFKPSNAIQSLVQQSFHDQVNPVLAEDGGAMELVGVEIKPTGEISADVALIGSCNGCSSAETTTLNGATKKIRDVLEVAKNQHASNPDIQKLLFKSINIREIPELVMGK